MSVLKYVWMRGAILIIKKFKFLRLQESPDKHKWTLKGPEIERFECKEKYSDRKNQEKVHLHNYNLTSAFVH